MPVVDLYGTAIKGCRQSSAGGDARLTPGHWQQAHFAERIQQGFPVHTFPVSGSPSSDFTYATSMYDPDLAVRMKTCSSYTSAHLSDIRCRLRKREHEPDLSGTRPENPRVRRKSP